MAIVKVYSVRDAKAEAWLPPMVARTKGEMLRMFEEAVNDSNHAFSKYPSDYCLFELGSWDDATCKYDLHLAPERIGLAVEFKKVVALAPNQLPLPLKEA